MGKSRMVVSNIRRAELINKGFMNQKEIQEFIPCGNKMAMNIFNEIRMKNEAEGIENLLGVVLSKRVLPYIGMTRAEVISAAKLERGA